MKIKSFFFFIFVVSNTFFSQTDLNFNSSVDFVNNYNWRGIEINSVPNIQPSLGITYKNISFGIWGSYVLDNDVSETNEIDFSVSYTVPNIEGDLTFSIVDYYFPNSGKEFSNFNNYDNAEGAGSHILEAVIQYTAKLIIPLEFLAAVNFHNDEGNNNYFEIGTSFSLNQSDLKIFSGATTGSKENPDYYGSEDFAVLNLGLSATRNINVSDSFSFNLSTTFIFNPNVDKAFLILGISI